MADSTREEQHLNPVKTVGELGHLKELCRVFKGPYESKRDDLEQFEEANSSSSPAAGA